MYNKEFETIMNYAAGKVDDIEVTLSSGKSFSVMINAQNIESFKYADAKGIGIRVLKDGKVGYSYTEKFDEDTFKKVIDEAVENARFSEDEAIVTMDNYPDIKEKPDVYCEDLEKLEINKKIQFAKDLEKIALDADKKVINVPYAAFGNSNSYVRIVNSKGLDKEFRTNDAFAYLGVLAHSQQDKRMAFDFVAGRDFSKFDAKKLAEKCARRSTELLDGEEITSGVYPVVLTKEMMATVLGTFSGLFSAKSVQEGRSLLAGKLNSEIANELVTIVDDALHPEGYATRTFDSEGYPSQKTMLVEKGKLTSYLHNTITARKDKTKSTGNAARSYKGMLGISSSNFYLEPGDNEVEKLYSAHDTVVEIVSLQGMHSGCNPISGDFSLSAEGFLYQDGKKKHSLKPFTISGNFIDLLDSVEMIANDFKFDMSSVGSASTLISKLNISS
jgi:PmbA protein